MRREWVGDSIGIGFESWRRQDSNPGEPNPACLIGVSTVEELRSCSSCCSSKIQKRFDECMNEPQLRAQIVVALHCTMKRLKAAVWCYSIVLSAECALLQTLRSDSNFSWQLLTSCRTWQVHLYALLGQQRCHPSIHKLALDKHQNRGSENLFVAHHITVWPGN